MDDYSPKVIEVWEVVYVSSEDATKTPQKRILLSGVDGVACMSQALQLGEVWNSRHEYYEDGGVNIIYTMTYMGQLDAG